MKAYQRSILFALFFVSGFCGLLYQVIWVRLAFASFGIITPVISVVISVFMLGLALGSWAGGKAVLKLTRKFNLSAITLYAVAELLIGIGAFAVPSLFSLGETNLLRMGESNSLLYLLFSAVAIALSILPWTTLMGATFPLMMAYVKEFDRPDAQSFSFLYLANVFGALSGTLLTAAVLVELLGFRHTLWVAGAANFLIAAVSFALGLLSAGQRRSSENSTVQELSSPRVSRAFLIYAILFTTGFASLAMEVIWTRAFTPILGTQVYSFASLLFVYLLGTWIGSHLYRRDLGRARVWPIAQLLALLAVVVFLPIILNDPRILDSAKLRILVAMASIFPFCAALGYLTPLLIDEYSIGDPRLAGKAYALNVLGCIFGPLLASYVLLQFLGANLSLVILALPFLIFFLIYYRSVPLRWRRIAGPIAILFLLCSLFISDGYEDHCDTVKSCEVRRDYAATVTSTGEGLQKTLYVNGIGITVLTPITKYMAHLPLAFHRGQPESGLVICFGAGTTYRSVLSWNIRATAVELVPSVKESFPYFHADAEALFKHPQGQIVIDDGRRFLNRTGEAFDVIVVDPPPPVEAAGSSLLYSKEFYEAVKRRLKPGGVFQTWFPDGEEGIQQAIAKSLVDAFPYVKAYRSIEGWGLHFIASMTPLESPTAETLHGRLPAGARDDLTEWGAADLESDLEKILLSEIPVVDLLNSDPLVAITDDRPYNEYFFLRRTRQHR